MWNFKSKNKSSESQVKYSETPEKTVKEIELETHLGNLVICVSNEIGNITVGYGKEIIHMTKAKSPFLVVHDLVRDKEITPFGIVFSYTEQKFNALNKLEPNERIAILYNRLEDNEVNKNLKEGEVLHSPEEWKEKVSEAIKNWVQSKQKKHKP